MLSGGLGKRIPLRTKRQQTWAYSSGSKGRHPCKNRLQRTRSSRRENLFVGVRRVYSSASTFEQFDAALVNERTRARFGAANTDHVAKECQELLSKKIQKRLGTHT